MDSIGYNFEFDPVKLISLGFTKDEINYLSSMISMGYKINNNTLAQLGLGYEQMQRIKYMYNICCGKVNIETEEELIRHLRKLNNHAIKIGIQNLPVSKIASVPRVAVVAGIKEEPYTIWNSNKYKGKEMLYLVKDVTSSNIEIETSRKPQLKYGSAMKIDGVLEIKGVRANGKAVILFNKKYCRLCNRFIIVATLRKPEFHHGLYKIICSEGTRVYVYARTMGVREGVKYSMGTERVYAFGFFPDEIEPKLRAVAKQVYGLLHGVSSYNEGANQDYVILDKVRKDTDFSDEIEA